VYQPIVYDQNPHPVAYESLLRWNHHELGPVPPLDIITTAEQTGLIESLTLWIIARVAADAARIRSVTRGAPIQPSLAINLSFSQLEIPGIRQVLLANAARYDIAPEALTIEVTETKLINASDAAADAIADLADAGFTLALDDFGTGYSSLEYLTRLPFASLKIDRAIVSRVADNPSARRIVGAIHTMCSDLGMAVIAEGVETADELEQCRALGLTEFQGYHLGRPAPLERWLDLYRGAGAVGVTSSPS
jgi:EAL domain-containing protein (putative c-di-GMP-specific phosphodiesterase class I)